MPERVSQAPAAEVEAAEARTLAPPGRRAAEVTSNERVGAYRLIAVEDADGPPDPRPGQFYMLSTARGWGGGADERPYLPRAFSFARSRQGSDGSAARAQGPATGVQLEFLLEEVGPGTERLGGVAAGDQMLLTGPLGVGFRPPPAGPAGALLVGGGIGVAPILCWHDELGEEARILLGFRSRAHAEASRLFGDAATVSTDDGSAGRHARVTEPLREELDSRVSAGSAPTVFACGPPPMLEAVRAICAEREVPAQLALESGMACGYGACFGCVVPTRSGYVRLCVDGPVLDAAELETAVGPGMGH